jgi:hypothetical protein
VPQALAGQQNFASPEEAVRVMVEALKTNDTTVLSSIFGPQNEDLIFSGDPVADRTARLRFLDFYQEKHLIAPVDGGKVFLLVGSEDWPFPIPVVQQDDSWRFDSDEGRQEIVARRIGRNELNVIQVCLAYVDAQREYALRDHDSDGLLEYARNFASAPGKKNGLFWKTEPGQPPSPLGELAAAAYEEGYRADPSGAKPVAFYGYHFRILEAQGASALGGAYDYVLDGKMIGGFAMVAYPAQYGVSGIMTFIVSHHSIVYQKDLGEESRKIALSMELFDPDDTWQESPTNQ